MNLLSPYREGGACQDGAEVGRMKTSARSLSKVYIHAHTDMTEQEGGATDGYLAPPA